VPPSPLARSAAKAASAHAITATPLSPPLLPTASEGRRDGEGEGPQRGGGRVGREGEGGRERESGGRERGRAQGEGGMRREEGRRVGIWVGWGRLGVGLVGSKRGWNEGLPSVHVKTHNKVFVYGVSPSRHMAKLIKSIIVVNKLKISYDFRKLIKINTKQSMLFVAYRKSFEVKSQFERYFDYKHNRILMIYQSSSEMYQFVNIVSEKMCKTYSFFYHSLHL
jgi:hypothetical protein